MPRPKTNPNARSHHKKPAPASPALEAMVDTLTEDIDGLNPEDLPFDGSPAPKAAPKRASTAKPGPKKVLNETNRIVGDGLAIGVAMLGNHPDKRKALSMPEAQSIAHPVVRMLARRVPGWIKPYLPKTKMNPDDAADVEEILATLATWGMRLLTVVVSDFFERKEQQLAARQQKDAGNAPQGRGVQSEEWARMAAMSSAAVPMGWTDEEKPEAKVQAGVREQAAALATPSSNGHNPAFDVLNNVDIGFAGE